MPGYSSFNVADQSIFHYSHFGTSQLQAGNNSGNDFLNLFPLQQTFVPLPSHKNQLQQMEEQLHCSIGIHDVINCCSEHNCFGCPQC